MNYEDKFKSVITLIIVKKLRCFYRAMRVVQSAVLLSSRPYVRNIVVPSAYRLD